MEEIEVKILDVDRKKVEERLIELGAKKIFDDKMVVEKFDFDNDQIKKDKNILRLRQEGNKAVITLKKYISTDKAKIMKETETEVGDIDKAKEILEYLGLSVFLRAERHRTSYLLDDVHFDFDNYSGEYEFIPEYLEIEAPSIEKIHEYAEKVGIKKEDCKPWTFFQVVDYYKK